MQLFTSVPSTSIEQAPQLPVSQPMWLPVRSRSSRTKWIRSRRASTSRSYCCPLTSTVIVLREVASTSSFLRPARQRAGRGSRPDVAGSRLRRARPTADRGRRPGLPRAQRRARPIRALTRTGVASTHPIARRGAPPSIEAATLTMHVPSLPIGTDAKPSLFPGGTEIFVNSSPCPTAVM